MIESVALDWRFGTIEVPSADRYIRRSIELTGEYSGDEVDLYQALLRPGDLALDVGANVGVLSIAMGLAVGPSGRVLAFEPQPPIFAMLERNLAAHGLPQVEASRAIVGDGDRPGQFVDIRKLPPGEQLNFGAVSTGTRIYDGYGGMVPTPVKSVDGLGLDRCDLIKIDVEGAEGVVLAGAAGVVAAFQPTISIECDRPKLAAPLVERLLAAGYRLWRFRGALIRSPNPKGASLQGHGRISVLMLLAVPEGRLGVLDTVDRSTLQEIDSRQTFERLSQGIVRHRI